ncbi:MAG: hypothetical protein GEU90_18935, partial [Gemmatimonas sp.]|nr:hypothetical protein [Gemmatimonas sp.]
MSFSTARYQHSRQSFIVAIVLFAVAGCEGLDTLLSVDLPGEVQEDDLNDPRLAPALLVGTEADFECALSPHIWVTGSWVDDLNDTAQDRPGAFFSTRSSNSRFYADHCTGTRPNYAPFQTARSQAERAVELISSFPDESVSDKDYLLARGTHMQGTPTSSWERPIARSLSMQAHSRRERRSGASP